MGVRGLGKDLADACQGIDLLALRIELEREPGAVARGDVADLDDAGYSARDIAAAPVYRAHDRPAVERLGPAARLVEVGEEFLALAALGPDPAERDAHAGRGDAGRAHEVEHGLGRLPTLSRAGEVEAAELDGLPPGLAHDLEHAPEWGRVEGPSMESERIQH